MKPLTLTQASKTCKKAKATLLDAIKSGRLSARKNDKEIWEIDPAELHRVYPYQLENAQENQNLPSEKPKPTAQELLETLEKERVREREQMQATIDDLRKRLDEEAEERRKLTKLLTHQTEHAEQKKGNVLFKRIFKNR